MIRNRLKIAYSWQKSYADDRRRDLEFEEGDKVYLKISPMKGVIRFCKKGKLSPRYVGPYENFQRVGKVAYKLRLPSELAFVHLVFHVSMLKKCIGDTEFIRPIGGIDMDENLCYEEVPVEIHNRQVMKLKNKEVASIKVLWMNHLVLRETKEAKADKESRYPHLFVD